LHVNLVPKRVNGPWYKHPLVVIAVFAVVAAAVIIALVWPVTDLIAAHDVGLVTGADRVARLQTARASVRTQLLTLGAGVFAFGALVYTARNFTLARSTFKATETRVLNERFTTIASQLGDDQAAVRLAGIHAMAGLADDWPQQRQTCVDVLCAYLRMPYEPDPGDKAKGADQLAYLANREVRHTAIRIISEHLRSAAPVPWQGLSLDFTGVVFDGGVFDRAEFTGRRVRFDRAEFRGEVSFKDARFSGGAVSFDDAKFSSGEADFTVAKFIGGTVSFDRAQFTGGKVSFYDARFSGAKVSFDNARFTRSEVIFGGSEFTAGTVSFYYAQLTGGAVRFDGVTGRSIVTGGKLTGSAIGFADAEFSGATVSFTGTNFSGATVSFGGSKFTDGTVNFNSYFTDGEVSFGRAQFTGGEVSFARAQFTGGTVDFRNANWSEPPDLPAWDHPPDGVMLPASNTGPSDTPGV
jgi:hypothetical protein